MNKLYSTSDHHKTPVSISNKPSHLFFSIPVAHLFPCTPYPILHFFSVIIIHIDGALTAQRGISSHLPGPPKHGHLPSEDGKHCQGALALHRGLGSGMEVDNFWRDGVADGV